MNQRIRKKKEKQLLMMTSLKEVGGITWKRRKRGVDKQWKLWHDANCKLDLKSGKTGKWNIRETRRKMEAQGQFPL